MSSNTERTLPINKRKTPGFSSPGLNAMFKRVTRKVEKEMLDLTYIEDAKVVFLVSDSSGSRMFGEGHGVGHLISTIGSLLDVKATELRTNRAEARM